MTRFDPNHRPIATDAESIYAVANQAGDYNFYCYSCGQNSWHIACQLPVNAHFHSKLASGRQFAQGQHNAVHAVLSHTENYHYSYDLSAIPHPRWERGPNTPEWPGISGCLAHDPEADRLYLVIGRGLDYFYGRGLGGADYDDGAQSLLTSKPKGRARILNASGGVRVSYGLAVPTRVQVSIYDMAGRVVKSLFEGHQQAGDHSLTWDYVDNDGRRVSYGVYFIVVDRGGERDRLKAIAR